MSGAYGGSKSETAGMSEEFYDWLGAVAGELYEEITPLRRNFISTLEGALRGEAEGGMVPVVAQAVESAKQASSRTERGTAEELARTGLSGTPFGASILSQTRAQGEQAGSMAETNILQQLINAIPNFTLGLGQTATMPSAGGGTQASGKDMSGGMSV